MRLLNLSPCAAETEAGEAGAAGSGGGALTGTLSKTHSPCKLFQLIKNLNSKTHGCLSLPSPNCSDGFFLPRDRRISPRSKEP